MTARLRVFGVDPGPTPGIAMLHYVDGKLGWANLVQATSGVALDLLEHLVTDGAERWPMTLIGIERFVTRGRTNGAGRITLDQVGQVEQLGQALDVAVLQRTASQVKHWATDTRLNHVQVPRSSGRTLLELTVGMRHARDAARHALFTASHDGLVADPLSKHSTEGARA